MSEICVDCKINKDPRGLRCQRCHLSRFSPVRNRKGKNNYFWKGGKTISNGYVYLYAPEHPFRNTDNKVAEHRLVVESYLKRFLTKREVVHHINGDKQDNRIENLKVYSSAGWHSIVEHADRDANGRFIKRV